MHATASRLTAAREANAGALERCHRSWLIHQEQLDALDTDYIALGHWDRAVRVGAGDRSAYYSGSPDLAKTVNVVRFRTTGAVIVERQPLAEVSEP